VPPITDGVNFSTCRRSPGSSVLASRNNERCSIRNTKYPSAKTTGPCNPPGMSSNASGMVSANTNIVAIAANIAIRARPSSARTTFPSQA
jgi:hypothetical protein